MLVYAVREEPVSNAEADRGENQHKRTESVPKVVSPVSVLFFFPESFDNEVRIEPLKDENSEKEHRSDDASNLYDFDLSFRLGKPDQPG